MASRRSLASAYSMLYTWTVPVVGWGTIVALVVFRRFRHVLCFFGALLVVLAITYIDRGHRPTAAVPTRS